MHIVLTYIYKLGTLAYAVSLYLKKGPILKWLTKITRKLAIAKYFVNKSFNSLAIVSDAVPKCGQKQGGWPYWLALGGPNNIGSHRQPGGPTNIGSHHQPGGPTNIGSHRQPGGPTNIGGHRQPGGPTNIGGHRQPGPPTEDWCPLTWNRACRWHWLSLAGLHCQWAPGMGSNMGMGLKPQISMKAAVSM
jgi:hypothetical protein